MAMIAAVFVVAVAFAVQQVATASEPDVRATSADGSRGSSIATDPFVSRHAEVVAR